MDKHKQQTLLDDYHLAPSTAETIDTFGSLDVALMGLLTYCSLWHVNRNLI